jgi:alpha-ketoglutarate-dependent taurine dioxygenase
MLRGSAIQHRPKYGSESVIIHPTGRFDNRAQHYEHIVVEELAAAMGAEVKGVDLAGLTDAQFTEIEHALFRHKMIFFRDQQLSHADHESFSLRFGEFADDAYTKGVDGHVNVQPVIREAGAEAAMIFGSGWHTDSAFLERPPSISMLYGVDIPPYGGDTIWANSALAYNTLSDTMKAMLAGLRVRMSMRRVLATAQDYMEPDDTAIGRLAATRDAERLDPETSRKVRGTVHPLIRTHPVTGEKSLYCDKTYAVGIEGLTEAESAPLLSFLSDHATQPAFTCRLRWDRGTFTVWDNRLCLHQAFNDHDGYRREMYRTTVAGEVPS